MKLKHIGITGGIGSGKSTVGRMFTSIGYCLYHADARAKWLMTEDPTLVQQVKDLFGPETYFPDGRLNRAFLGNIVFKDASALNRLNGIVHPATARDYLQWIQSIPDAYDKHFALKEAAIMYESGAYKYSDAIITVYAPKSIRLARVIARDQVEASVVMSRMNKQWPEVEKKRRAEFLIVNDGEHSLVPQVLAAIRWAKQL
ncbi:MAG: dephospho-CoA kinase [Bacteroidota bacterium]